MREETAIDVSKANSLFTARWYNLNDNLLLLFFLHYAIPDEFLNCKMVNKIKSKLHSPGKSGVHLLRCASGVGSGLDSCMAGGKCEDTEAQCCEPGQDQEED